jgi:hypothetical protein
MNKASKIEIPIHPLAELFAMWSSEALDDLASDIKQNGQRLPILLDHEGRLVDGRNRLAACKRAGVEPRFEYLAEGEDLYAVVASLNAKRRESTASQRAIAAAEAWKIAEEEGRVRKQGARTDLQPLPKEGKGLIANPREHFGALFNVGKNYVEMARTVIENPAQSVIVKTGVLPLPDVFGEAKRQKQKTAAQVRIIKRLRIGAPDLAEAVDAGKLTHEAAEKELDAREDDARKLQASRRRTVIDLTQSAYSSMLAWSAEGFADDVMELLADDEFRVEIARMVRLDPAQLAELPHGLAALNRVLEYLAKGAKHDRT